MVLEYKCLEQTHTQTYAYTTTHNFYCYIDTKKVFERYFWRDLSYGCVCFRQIGNITFD